jgi:FHS family L-fucose permease-like MFS transporter
MTTHKQSYALPMTIIGALFFIFGFVTWVNGSLIPYLKIACQLETDLQSYLVATAFFIAYTVMAIPSSYVLRKTGYKKGMSLGLLIMAAGALLFIPAAQARDYNMFLIGLFIIGSGLAVLQTASNPYVSIIGPIESAAKRISIMGICNKVAGILAGLIFGHIALKDAGALELSLQSMDAASREVTLQELAGRVIIPYIIIAVILVLLAVAILFSGLPEMKDEQTSTSGITDHQTEKGSVLKHRNLVLGVIALFLYVGVEVMAGDTVISYGKSLGIPLDEARYYTQWTLGFMLLGYVIGILAIPKRITQERALAISAVLGVLFTIAALITSGKTSVFFIALLGLANSLMWPAIFPLAIAGLGKFTKIGSALLIMAISGGAILPLIYGKLSLVYGSQLSYSMMIPCYLFILHFAVLGYKLKPAKRN